MKKSRWLRLLSFALLLTVLAVALLLITSPYRANSFYPVRAVTVQTIINRPVDSVFAFLGNSGNARRWSVYVDHINTLNAGAVPDGQPGSERRCFRHPDEKGLQWDERILLMLPGRQRRLSIYHMVDFPLSADSLVTDQRYESLGPDQTRLTFTLLFQPEAQSNADALKMRLAAHYVKRVYTQNLANIKSILEGGGAVYGK